MKWLTIAVSAAMRLPGLAGIIALVVIGVLLLGVGCAGQLLKLPFGGASAQECADLVQGLADMVLGSGPTGPAAPSSTIEVSPLN
jgi:hypothetical protein